MVHHPTIHVTTIHTRRGWARFQLPSPPACPHPVVGHRAIGRLTLHECLRCGATRIEEGAWT